MLSLNDFVKMSNNPLFEGLTSGKVSLNFFDIDETLFSTSALIYVMKDGNIIRKLTNQEFNVYDLKPNETFDFREFRSSDIFVQNAQPIKSMISKLNAMFKNMTKSGGEMYLLTARADFDEKDKLLNFFRSYNIDVGHKDLGKIHIIRAGNLPNKSAQNKKDIIEQYLATGKYYKVRLYDDASTNLDAFLELRETFPNVIFEAYLITHGEMTKYD